MNTLIISYSDCDILTIPVVNEYDNLAKNNCKNTIKITWKQHFIFINMSGENQYITCMTVQYLQVFEITKCKFYIIIILAVLCVNVKIQKKSGCLQWTSELNTFKTSFYIIINVNDTCCSSFLQQFLSYITTCTSMHVTTSFCRFWCKHINNKYC